MLATNEPSKPKSLIAILAERRKTHKSIHSFAPNAIPAAAIRAAKPIISSGGGSTDLLGDILASQTQLKQFGSREESRFTPPVRSVTNRVLSAILASKDTLSRLDRDLEHIAKTVNNGSDSAAPSSQKPQCASDSRSCQQAGSKPSGKQAQASGTPASNGASDGGDDPDGNRRKRKSEPEDKPEEGDEEESMENQVELQFFYDFTIF